MRAAAPKPAWSSVSPRRLNTHIWSLHPGDSHLGSRGWALEMILLLGGAYEPGFGRVAFCTRLCPRPWSRVSVWLVLASSLVSLRSLPLPVSEASYPTSVPGVIWPLPPFWPVLLPASPPVVPPTCPLFPGPLAGSCPRVSAPAVPFPWAARPHSCLPRCNSALAPTPPLGEVLSDCLPPPASATSSRTPFHFFPAITCICNGIYFFLTPSLK